MCDTNHGIKYSATLWQSEQLIYFLEVHIEELFLTRKADKRELH